jgi:hypothetical protein
MENAFVNEYLGLNKQLKFLKLQHLLIKNPQKY